MLEKGKSVNYNIHVILCFFVDDTTTKEYTMYFLHIIEGISLDVTFNDLNEFLEFRQKTEDIESICYSSIYKIEHLNESKKTLTLQSKIKTIPNMTTSDMDLVQFTRVAY